MDFVSVERGDVSVLTIDRQEKLNALDPQVVEEIGQALLELEAEGPRAVVVTGAGERSFVAGADISAMSEMDPRPGLAVKSHTAAARVRGRPVGAPRSRPWAARAGTGPLDLHGAGSGGEHGGR